MARMRWMHDDGAGAAMMVCMNCDTTVAEDASRVFYCYCKSSGVMGDVVASSLSTEGWSGQIAP